MGNLHKPYTKVSVNKQIELLEKRHNKKIKRRRCFYIAEDWLKAGYITRQPRHKNGSGGFISQLSSMIAFTLKGANFLISLGIEKGLVIKHHILHREENEDRRFPTKTDYTEQRNAEMDREEKRRLEDLVEKVTKPFPA